MDKLKQSLSRGLTPEQALIVKQEFSASPALRAQLAKIIDDKINTLENASIAKASYDSPAWGYLQADANGAKRALKEIKSIIF